MTRRSNLVSLLILLSAVVFGAAMAWRPWESHRPLEPNWLAAFISPMHRPIAGDPVHNDRALRFSNVTLRQFFPLTLPGERIRLSISNEFGDAPLQIGAVHVAWREGASGATIQVNTDRQVFFSDQQQVAIAQGATIYSDPVELPVGKRADLAVSIYLPQPTPMASWHLVGGRSSYRSIAGDHVGAIDFPVSDVGRGVYFLTGVETDAPSEAGLWVAFGDSITDGAWHTVDVDSSWPAQWAAAWRTHRNSAPIGVLNAGVGGNRLISDHDGPSGLARFRRDVLNRKGVRGVVILIGINDLGGRDPSEELFLLVKQLIAAQTLLVDRARAHGLKVVGATITPVGGSFYGVPEVEAARQQFNRWIRDSSVFDAVVDFDAVIRDPARLDRIRSEWTSDQLHPNDAGYRVMAEAVVRTLADAGLEPH